MNALGKRISGLFSVRGPRTLPESEPINCKPRQMTGLWGQLTPEEKAKARAYKGPECHGDPAFLIKR